jgi:hypothetical protein
MPSDIGKSKNTEISSTWRTGFGNMYKDGWNNSSLRVGNNFSSNWWHKPYPYFRCHVSNCCEDFVKPSILCYVASGGAAKMEKRNSVGLLVGDVLAQVYGWYWLPQNRALQPCDVSTVGMAHIAEPWSAQFESVEALKVVYFRSTEFLGATLGFAPS